jgi:hypothetical protein
VSTYINVRISAEKRARIAKWGARSNNKVSAVVRHFVDKCLEYCDEFQWEDFGKAKIVPGDESATASGGPAAQKTERKTGKS